MSYQFMESKEALVFEILLPKKMAYASKLQEVMDAFISDDRVLEIPEIKKVAAILRKTGRRQRKFIIRRIREVISGYSIYEVDGRIATYKGPVDERTWVIRLIIHDPRNRRGMDKGFRTLANTIVQHLIGKRFAEELGTEDEIWILEYHKPQLLRWVKKPAGG